MSGRIRNEAFKQKVMSAHDAAGLSIAYCAKPVTAAHADVAINFPRLDAVAAFAFKSVPVAS